jgi:hypothetical protein
MEQTNQAMVTLGGVDGVLAKHTSGAYCEQYRADHENTAHLEKINQD